LRRGSGALRAGVSLGGSSPPCPLVASVTTGRLCRCRCLQCRTCTTSRSFPWSCLPSCTLRHDAAVVHPSSSALAYTSCGCTHARAFWPPRPPFRSLSLLFTWGVPLRVPVEPPPWPVRRCSLSRSTPGRQFALVAHLPGSGSQACVHTHTRACAHARARGAEPLFPIRDCA
jgi:hypothetical protein